MDMDYTMWESDELSVEAIVARNMGDEDADELADETPHWRLGGSRAKTFEVERLRFDNVRRETDD